MVFGAKTTIPIFPAAWWSSNLLLALALLALVYNGVREFSVRRYLDGYSDAIVQKYVPAQAKVEAILNWMRAEPSRGIAEHPETLARRDSQTTLNSIQLSKVCGRATNAFLIVDDSTKNAVLFDAPNDTVAPLLDEVDRHKWNLIGLWLTHGHFDHMADHEVIRSRFPAAKILIHKLDEPKLQRPGASFALPIRIPPAKADGFAEVGIV